MKLSNVIANTLKPRAFFGSARLQPYTGRPYQQIKNDEAFIAPCYTHYYKEPFLVVEGHQEFLYDQNGREYIDLMGGISCMNIGHSHPRITKVYQTEKDRLLNLSSYYTHQYQGEYADKLCKELGNDLDTVFFFNSGSESNDFAYNLAKAYTKNNIVVALRNGYHGTAGNAYNLTSIGTWTTPLAKGNALERLAWPNFYRNAHSSVESLIKDAEEQLDSNTNGKVAGLWLEPVMGAGGIIPLQKSYVQAMHRMVKKMGGLYISDEVQTGFCRIGKESWGFKWQEVKPDIVVMAKAIGNGVPFSAVATRREIADALTHEYFPTFAGGPLECRLGMEVLDVLKEENYAQKAEEIGTYLQT
jgi:alanine-glyoxylate transaminase/(R)-3-amino-2-methylpropionate-pyruvate transaminase